MVHVMFSAYLLKVLSAQTKHPMGNVGFFASLFAVSHLDKQRSHKLD